MRLPLFLFARRAGPVGLAITAFDIWRRIPPTHRRRILQASRTHGPRIASALVNASRRRPPRR